MQPSKRLKALKNLKACFLGVEQMRFYDPLGIKVREKC